jgi:Glycosyl transferase family 1
VPSPFLRKSRPLPRCGPPALPARAPLRRHCSGRAWAPLGLRYPPPGVLPRTPAPVPSLDLMPDVVISDFESFTYAFVHLHRLPLLSIDNMQVLNRAKLDLKLNAEQRRAYLMAKTGVKAKLPYCSQYLITSFFNCPVDKKNTELVPPILRPEISAAYSKRKKGRDVLVYQTATAQGNRIEVLKSLKHQRFMVFAPFPWEASSSNG